MTGLPAGYDAWLTTQPEPPDIPLPGDPGYPTCECGAFLRREPDGRADDCQTERCSGIPDIATGFTMCGQDGEHDEHDEVVAAWTTEWRNCRRCGKDNYTTVC